MKISNRYTFLLLSIFTIGTLYTNCSDVKFATSDPAGANATPTTPGADTSPTAPNETGPTVCNPFGGGTTGSSKQGLVADGIYYVENIDQSQTSANQTAETIINGTVENLVNPTSSQVGYQKANIFLNSVDFPSMYFINGFVDTSTGTAFMDGANNVLHAYFGFRLQSVFVPGDWAPGDYQIASLTDDGSILTLSGAQADGSDFILKNDGEHAMTLGCTSSVIHVTANSSFKMTMDYMQGPPVTIGLMLLYRPVSVSNNVAEPICGTSSDTAFFLDHDSNNNAISPSTPQPTYTQLTGAFGAKATGSGGWKVVEANHFNLPAAYTNPCATN